MRRLWMSLVVSAALLATSAVSAQNQMSHSRQLRRTYLSVLGRGPTLAEYQAFLAMPEGQRGAALVQFTRSAMETPEFYEQVRDWGQEYLGVPGYMGSRNIHTYQFDGTLSPQLSACGPGTLHEGRVGLLTDNAGSAPQYGQHVSICEDAGADVAEVEPWWAPGTTIGAIGDVALERSVGDGGEDCAQMRASFRSIAGCGCGPNLIHCTQRPIGEEGDYYIPDSMRRQLHEEPSRLFAHIVTNGRDFTDLVLGDYSVATRTVRMAYQRQARMTPENSAMDTVEWWRTYADSPNEWREVRISELHPQLIDDRNYHFDPRTEVGRPIGVPSAGVLTTIVANEAWPRERVRAANWIRSLACREFSPPASDVTFPPYENDPARQGPCTSCHQMIDPGAMHFKRLFDSGGLIAGVTDTWSLEGPSGGAIFRLRGHAEGAMIANTLMTPVDQATLDAGSDARFIDFMPAGTRLFGQEGTGTIGPLGFAQVLVNSGEFDQCAVRRAYQRYGGRDLVPGRDDVLLRELVTDFVDSERDMRELIVAIVGSDEFGLGI